MTILKTVFIRYVCMSQEVTKQKKKAQNLQYSIFIVRFNVLYCRCVITAQGSRYDVMYLFFF